MVPYRLPGVKKAPKAREVQQCCEPVCGPSTCGGTAAEVKEETKVKVVK